ncbi:MAG: YggS family pyridoxal phosphate-dependent enzyme [Anaerolineae bacterium]|jgi:pyridoxal phosphate enzyme (YggS family)|nr:YggS family pyridoxal phosphate-dependent enzyme [Anaerolineae bacterium]
MATVPSLECNLRAVNERIAEAAARAGRSPDAITLVAVTKTVPAEIVAAAWELGVRHFGENRVEEAEAKIPAADALIAVPGQCPTWHMVGHIQSRKAREVVSLFDFVHSVDSVKLVAELDKRAAAVGRTVPCLLEINTSGEASKYGVAGDIGPSDPAQAGAVLAVAQALAGATHLQALGLMTLGPLAAPEAHVRRCFQTLRRWQEFLAGRVPQAQWRHLSMGMSDDFEIAVEEGATIVRIGRAIFQGSS